ncbi:MAG: hypothetical protein ACOCV3_00365 [Halanaerobiales bacterium]
MKRIKTAYEIAMEKADELAESDEQSDKLAKKEEIKPIMSRFFRGKIDTEDLWQEIKDKEDEEYYVQAQELIIDSFGLRNSDEEFDRRKEGLLALESLKGRQNSSMLEQILGRLNKLRREHQQQRKSMEERFKKEMEERSQMQMKPVQTEDGRTVMKLESGVDEETRQKVQKQLSQLEERSEQMFTDLIEELKTRI